MYGPKDIENMIRLCAQHNYYLARPQEVNKVMVPICSKNAYMCEYAGRLIVEAGGPICKGALIRESARNAKLKQFLDDKL